MENPQSRTIADVFNILDCWRHLPKFRLEPQIAPFFSLFLGDVFRENKKLDVEIHPIVIPEFLLKVDVLAEESTSVCCKKHTCPFNPKPACSNRSYNVDYLVLSQCGTKVFLVELKTDMESVRDEQNCYLKRACSAGIGSLVCGVREIRKTTEKKKKYEHLLHRLSKLGFCGNVKEGAKECKVVYIQPHKDGKKDNSDFKYIYFNDVADVVQGHGELGVLFANYLRAWTEPAGERNPAKIAHYR